MGKHVTLIIKVETLMIKVTCLPNYYLFGDLHTADIIPSTFFVVEACHPLKLEENRRSNVSYAIDSCFVRCPQGFPVCEGMLDSIYEETFRGRISIPKKREDI